MIYSDISVRIAKGSVLIEGSKVISYHSETPISPHAHAICRAHPLVLRSTTSSTIVLSGKCLEMEVHRDLGPDCILVTETRTDALSN